MKRIYCLLLSFLVIVAGLAQTPTASRVAIVIGIKNYKHVPPLQNTLNDAMDMSNTLKARGFNVIEVFEPQSKRQMQDAVIKYFQLIKAGSVGLMYYSGHGVQVDGTNYLIPAGADPQIKADLEDQCLSMDYVMSAIEEAGNPLNIFILDACRNNPFRSFSRSAGRGLNVVTAPKGSYVVYSTKPGSVASDGNGRNGLFTSKLLKYINTPGLNIEQVFKKVAGDVSTESAGAQRPWISSDYTDDFFFMAGKKMPVPVVPDEPVVVNKKNPQEILIESGFNFSEAAYTMFPVKGPNGSCKVEAFVSSDKSIDPYQHTEFKINKSVYRGGECKDGFLNGFVLMTVDGDNKSSKQNILAYFVNGRILYPYVTTRVVDDHLGIGIQEEKSSYGCLRSGPTQNWNSVDNRSVCKLMQDIFGTQLFSIKFMTDFKNSSVDVKELERKFKNFVTLKTGEAL